MKMKLMLLTLLAGAGMCSAAEKPTTIYNHVKDESSAMDRLVSAALVPKFTIVDIRDSADYVPPKPTAGRLPRIARTLTGEPLGGNVLVAYVVTADGRATEAVVLKSDDERLNAIATKAMESWRFATATLKGVAIPTTAAQEFTFETPPTEFVPQVFEPAGGKIQRPKDWFYAEGDRGPVYMWTLSREDTTGNKPYTTGVRIQLFTKIKEGTGKTAKQFILDFVAAKKKEATKVIKTCKEQEQGLFTRICLETEEGPHHNIYSLFWGSSGMDMAVVSIAGTTNELWETYAPTFDKMNAIELIDMKRFEK
ncbi:MAG: TonB family protein [Chthoniobacteraceae bacterium]